ncbi:hypothetical protein AB4Z50_14785 [Paenibacillus sp. 2TAB26]|uniref:hypothetical protein n=1 Tax=Paenibacillus sp. 2TAB26 TaxID=3233005 RepID=UPI003F948259
MRRPYDFDDPGWPVDNSSSRDEARGGRHRWLHCPPTTETHGQAIRTYDGNAMGRLCGGVCVSEAVSRHGWKQRGLSQRHRKMTRESPFPFPFGKYKYVHR